jgi:transposase
MWEVAWSAATNSPIKPGPRSPRCCLRPADPAGRRRPPPSGQRHLVEAFYRGALAGPAGAVRPWQTCYERFRRWQDDGTWQRLLTHVQTKSDAVGEVDWEVVVDATIVRVHQHAAGARKGDPAATWARLPRVTRHWDAAGAG